MFSVVISTRGRQKDSEGRRWVIFDVVGDEFGRRMKAGEWEDVFFRSSGNILLPSS